MLSICGYGFGICNNVTNIQIADIGGLMFSKESYKEGRTRNVRVRHANTHPSVTLAHTGTMTGTHWHTLAYTGTHWHYQCVYRMVIANVLDSLLYARRPCQNVSCRKVAAWGCEAAATRRQRTRRDIKHGRALWMTRQSGCGIKVDRGITRGSIKAMMRCLRI